MKYFRQQTLVLSLASALSTHAMEPTPSSSMPRFGEYIQATNSLCTDIYSRGMQTFTKQAVEELFDEGTLSPTDCIFTPDKIRRVVPPKVYKIRIGNSFPSLTKAQLDSFIDLVLKEEAIGNIQIPQDGKEQANYGYSFVGLHHVQICFLSDISNSFYQSGKRPKVADFGAGHGIMSWKILSLGGELTAVEKLRPVAQLLQEKVLEAKPFLNNTPLNSICRLSLGNVLNSKSKFYETLYDVTWSGNFLHMLTPEQAQNFIRKRFEITVPGGRAYDIVQTPENESLINFILKNKDEGIKFPGYIIVNQRYIGNMTELQTKGAVETRNLYEDLVPVCLAPKGTVPQIVKEGPFENPGKIQHKILPNDQFEIITSHFAMMFYDEDSLRSLYEEAGFIVEDIFYEYMRVKATDKLKADMGQIGFKLSIIARKPS